MAGKLLKETKDTEKKRRSKKKEVDNIYVIDTESNIKTIEDDEEEIDEIFGNVNNWLKDAEEVVEKKSKRKLEKIEDGIKSSKTTQKRKKEATKEEEKEEKVPKKRATKKTEEEEIPKKRTTKEIEKEEKKARKTATKKKNSKKVTELEETDILGENGVSEEIKETEPKPSEIKIHTENNLTEIVLKKNIYKIELQKTEYNIYTNKNETSYLIVRDPMLKITTDEGFILLEKQGDIYEITTNQDFKINYVIDNLERRNSEVNFKLTNITEIFAYTDGLVFEIDEEKVIENNLEDNNTLIISEEDGKVYLPYLKEDIKNEVLQNKGTKISDVIENKYVLPLDKYKNSMRARFREGYNLMYKKEGKSKRSAIMLGIELMLETNLHPAIISACKNLEELDIYLDCLEDNELEKFSCFKIIYKSLPTLRKKSRFQEN